MTTSKEEIGRMFGDVGAILNSVRHDYVFEIRESKIQRCFIYLDPDYVGRDTLRYHWLSQQAATVG
ncbi:MAG: hypothetical protein JOY58_01930 [Solirubrobacterales bacterium]|nr:hypothetical protein [Solirubrobacterales bacterium]MBV9046996.1 hypothetical protein [Solirubrobacterales bacterium]